MRNEERSPDDDLDLGIDREEVDSDEAITSPFDPTKINVVREPMSIFQAMRKVEMGEIKLDPEFQRNVVWDPIRQSRLIESVLLKIPLPALYLDAVEPNQWVVVDGLQRLYTMDRFMNKRALRLTGLEFLSRQFEGFSFDRLPRSSQRDIEETQLTMYIIRPETPPKVKFTIFHRINTGGMTLRPQEIRHAIFPGRAPKLLKELAGSSEFLMATLSSMSPKRMDDRECALRHLAFRITDFNNYPKADLNDFLGSAMDVLNRASDQYIHKLVDDFYKGMNICNKIFGINAFRKFHRGTGTRGPINKALFETWSTVVLDFDEIKLLNHANDIVDGLEFALGNDADYLKSLSLATGGIGPVQRRFIKAIQIINSVI